MNDQDKPQEWTSQYVREMSEEWTAENVKLLWNNGLPTGLQSPFSRIADAHNAALAAERARYDKPTADLHIGPFDTSEIKPTAGEWTVENLTRVCNCMGVSSASELHQRICDAHNAALAANAHKWNLDRLKDIKEVTDKAAQQLVTEREAKLNNLKCPTCGYQLVALDNDELAKLTEKAAYHELRRQLAAEREKVQTLMDALEIIEPSTSYGRTLKESTLAKVGK